jgi:hypothetical protein
MTCLYLLDKDRFIPCVCRAGSPSPADNTTTVVVHYALCFFTLTELAQRLSHLQLSDKIKSVKLQKSITSIFLDKTCYQRHYCIQALNNMYLADLPLSRLNLYYSIREQTRHPPTSPCLRSRDSRAPAPVIHLRPMPACAPSSSPAVLPSSSPVIHLRPHVLLRPRPRRHTSPETSPPPLHTLLITHILPPSSPVLLSPPLCTPRRRVRPQARSLPGLFVMTSRPAGNGAGSPRTASSSSRASPQGPCPSAASSHRSPPATSTPWLSTSPVKASLHRRLLRPDKRAPRHHELWHLPRMCGLLPRPRSSPSPQQHRPRRPSPRPRAPRRHPAPTHHTRLPSIEVVVESTEVVSPPPASSLAPSAPRSPLASPSRAPSYSSPRLGLGSSSLPCGH